MEQAVNSFQKGLLVDFHPMMLGNDSLSDALNATILTLDGNEYILLNDTGNILVADLRKSEEEKADYIPVGMKEYGGILYIASIKKPYTEIEGKKVYTGEETYELGTFPSPNYKLSVDGQNAIIDDIGNIQDFIRAEILSEIQTIGDKHYYLAQALNINKLLKDNNNNKNIEIEPGELYNIGLDNNNESITGLDIKLGIINSNNLVIPIENITKAGTKEYSLKLSGKAVLIISLGERSVFSPKFNLLKQINSQDQCNITIILKNNEELGEYDFYFLDRLYEVVNGRISIENINIALTLENVTLKFFPKLNYYINDSNGQYPIYLSEKSFEFDLNNLNTSEIFINSWNYECHHEDQKANVTMYFDIIDFVTSSENPEPKNLVISLTNLYNNATWSSDEVYTEGNMFDSITVTAENLTPNSIYTGTISCGNSSKNFWVFTSENIVDNIIHSNFDDIREIDVSSLFEDLNINTLLNGVEISLDTTGDIVIANNYNNTYKEEVLFSLSHSKIISKLNTNLEFLNNVNKSVSIDNISNNLSIGNTGEYFNFKLTHLVGYTPVNNEIHIFDKVENCIEQLGYLSSVGIPAGYNPSTILLQSYLNVFEFENDNSKIRSDVINDLKFCYLGTISGSVPKIFENNSMFYKLPLSNFYIEEPSYTINNVSPILYLKEERENEQNSWKFPKIAGYKIDNSNSWTFYSNMGLLLFNYKSLEHPYIINASSESPYNISFRIKVTYTIKDTSDNSILNLVVNKVIESKDFGVIYSWNTIKNKLKDPTLYYDNVNKTFITKEMNLDYVYYDDKIVSNLKVSDSNDYANGYKYKGLKLYAHQGLGEPISGGASYYDIIEQKEYEPIWKYNKNDDFIKLYT